jgi:hypothetical protein
MDMKLEIDSYTSVKPNNLKEFVNFHIIEAFKNGRMFSSKYQSSLRIFKPAKVVCFANFEPDWKKLSLDRWCCLDMTDNKMLQKIIFIINKVK